MGRLIVVLVALLAGAPATAHAAGARLWETVPGKPAAGHAGNPAAVKASRFRALTVEQRGLRELLEDAPPGASAGSVTIALPAPGGGFARFAVRRSQVMTPKLAANHPEIRTYAGRGIDDPRATVHLDLSPIGFHASVRGPGGTWYIDPYYRNDRSLYASYQARHLLRAGTFEEGEVVSPEPFARLTDARAPGAPVTLRTYRLALLTDPSYSAYHGGGSAVKAAKVALINRVSQIYEDDLGIRIQLIAGDLEFDTATEMTGPNGPCGAQACFTADEAASCAPEADPTATLDRTMVVLGQLAGAETFDVGHLGLGTDGGGIAYRGVVGGSFKAGGCTGTPQPRGDAYAVDYVAHELGHQFSGNHTFNGVQGACSAGNRSASTSVEPGSGSSVMAYAGICGPDDLQAHTDPYFSQRSLQEIAGYVSAAPRSESEVQTVSLRGYDANGDAFRLTFGAAQSDPIVRGTNYTATAVRTAVQALTGETVSVTGFGGGAFGDAGFQVRFADTDDHAELGLAALSGATGFVGTTVQGGPGTNGGSAVATSSNRAPVVTAPADATIPLRTPFRLVGGATDPDGDPVTYSWEQNDPGGSTGVRLLTQPKPNGPLFRQFSTAAVLADPLTSPAAGANLTTTKPERVFPDLAQIISGRTNAATGSCPSNDVECFSEFLPTSDYLPSALHFRLTGRDGQAPAGGVSFDDVTLTLAKSAGPFAVTAPESSQPLPAGGPATVTWNVAGTSAAPVSTANVEIRLSTNGGATFPTVLEASTPNDGSATVTLPAVSTTRARIQVAAVGNVFFDVSGVDLTIQNVAGPVVSTDVPATGATVRYSDAFATPPTISAYDSDTSALTISAPALPAGLSFQQQPADGKTRKWTLAGAADAAPGTYDVPVTVTDGAGNQGTTTLRIAVAPEDATARYTGETTKQAAADATTATLQLAAEVTETADATPGDITTATVAFRRGGQTLCTAPVTPVAGEPGTVAAACAAGLPQGSSTVTVTVGGRYRGTVDQTVTVTGGRQQPQPTAEPTVVSSVEPTVTPTPEPPAAVALLEPSLLDVRHRLSVSRRGRLSIPVTCVLATSGLTPERCTGAVVLTAKVAGKHRTIAKRSFSVAPNAVARVPMRLTRAARRALRDRRLRARLSVAVLNGDAPAATERKTLVLGRR